jgi:phage protein D
MPVEVLTAAFQIKVDGSPLGEPYYHALHSATVDTSLHLPDMAVLEFRLDSLDLLDGTTVAALGKEIEILANSNSAGGDRSTEESVFKGRVAAIQASYGAEHEPRLVVRAYSGAYGLQLGSHVRTFVNVKDSDIASKIAGEAGLQVKVDSTAVVHDHVFQANQSDWDFLQQRARLNGFVLVSKGNQIKFVKPSSLAGAAISLEYKTSLIDLDITVTSAGQATEMSAQGWDPAQKKAVSARSTSPEWKTASIGNTIKAGALGDLHAQSAKLLTTSATASTQQAQGIAKAEFDRGASQYVHAHGICAGNPLVNAGGRVKLEGVGTRFSGEYTVTRARHILNNKGGYTTEFWIGGMDRGTLASALTPEGQSTVRSPWVGLVPAIVTNNKDETAAARVKVKYPWLDDGLESHWARLVAPGAGQNRGLIMLPEVNDEVVVGFLQGDFNHPYVLGGVWNGKDDNPLGMKAVSGGNVELRQLKTRAGHEITLDDTKGGEKIQLLDSKGNTVVIDGGGKQILIETVGDFIVKAQGAIKITGKSIEMEGKAGDVKMKGINVAAEGSAKLALKAPLIDAAGSGPVTIKGTPVAIN